VSRDEISRGSQCRHGHPRRGRQPRHDHASVKGRGERGGASRDSAFADHRARARMTVCPRRPPLGTCRCEHAVFRGRGLAPLCSMTVPSLRVRAHILPTLACEWFSQQSCHQGPFGLRSSWVSLSYRAETAAWIDGVLPDHRFDCTQIPWRQPFGPGAASASARDAISSGFTGQVAVGRAPRPPWNPLLVRTSVVKWPLVTRLLGLGHYA
jgi:hypothetical protein